jgi:hypothetical protein
LLSPGGGTWALMGSGEANKNNEAATATRLSMEHLVQFRGEWDDALSVTGWARPDKACVKHVGNLPGARVRQAI